MGAEFNVAASKGWTTMKALLEKARVPALMILAAAAPLGAWLGVPLKQAGTKTVTFIGAFELVIWPALVLVLATRLIQDGPAGVFRALRRAPAAGWWLLALAAWSGLAWPRIVGDGAQNASFFAVAKELVQMAEYGLVAFVVTAELIREDERARRSLLAVLGAAFGLALAVGAVQYFSLSGRTAFQVGSVFGSHGGDGAFLPNSNAFGAFLAIMVPFAATLALGRSGCCCWWNAVWGLLAAGGALLVLSGGGLLGVVCGALAGAAVLGRRRLALAFLALIAVLAIGQALPRRNLSTAVASVSPVRVNPRNGEKVLAVRYLRYASELTVLSKGLSCDRSGKFFFGLGPGSYAGEKLYRPELDGRFTNAVGETDAPENFDVLANEPNSFDLWLGQAAQLGILGLAGFLWLFAWWAGAALRSWKRTTAEDPMRPLAAAAFAAVVGAAAAGAFGSPWIQGVGPLLGMAVAMAFVPLGRRKTEDGATEVKVIHV